MSQETVGGLPISSRQQTKEDDVDNVDYVTTVDSEPSKTLEVER